MVTLHIPSWLICLFPGLMVFLTMWAIWYRHGRKEHGELVSRKDCVILSSIVPGLAGGLVFFVAYGINLRLQDNQNQAKRINEQRIAEENYERQAQEEKQFNYDRRQMVLNSLPAEWLKELRFALSDEVDGFGCSYFSKWLSDVPHEKISKLQAQAIVDEFPYTCNLNPLLVSYIEWKKNEN